MKKTTFPRIPSSLIPLSLPPSPPGDDVSATPLDVYRQSRLRSHAEQRACLPGHGEAMRDATLVRQISPVFLARAQVPFEVDGPHRSHVGRGLINQGLTTHTHARGPHRAMNSHMSKYVPTHMGTCSACDRAGCVCLVRPSPGTDGPLTLRGANSYVCTCLRLSHSVPRVIGRGLVLAM